MISHSRTICFGLLLLFSGPSVLGPYWHQHSHTFPRGDGAFAASDYVKECCCVPNSPEIPSPEIVSERSPYLCSNERASTHDCSVCRFYKHFQPFPKNAPVSFEENEDRTCELYRSPGIGLFGSSWHARGPPGHALSSTTRF